jgi:hypothetical protein
MRGTRLPDAMLGIAVLAVVAALVLLGFWLAHRVEEREACGGIGMSLCQAIRESDSRECRAGEGCGQPLEGEP